MTAFHVDEFMTMAAPRHQRPPSCSAAPRYLRQQVDLPLRLTLTLTLTVTLAATLTLTLNPTPTPTPTPNPNPHQVDYLFGVADAAPRVPVALRGVCRRERRL